MNFVDIETALGQHLEAMTDCPPIAWPNKDYEPNGLYVEFTHSPTTAIDDTIDCVGPYYIGLVLITVIAPLDGFTTQSLEVAHAIATRFPKGLRLDAGDGKVLVNAAPSLVPAFKDGVNWRQPVRIAYITE